MKRRAWLIGVVLAAAACVVTAVTPQSTLVYSTNATRMPFDLPLEIGETTTGRTFSLEPVAVRASRSIESADGEIAEGAFVILDLVAEATGVDPTARLEGVTLELGGRSYSPTIRGASSSIDTVSLRAGLKTAGCVAFELAPEDLHGTARILIASDLDVRFDDRMVLVVDLDAVPLSRVEPMAEAGWAR